MTSAPILLAFRHGETDWNREGRFQGHADRQLASSGRLQAEAIGARLAAERAGGEATDAEPALWTSPLSRAIETMAIVAGRLGRSDWQITPALAEAAYGQWEGLTTLEVKALFPAARKARKADRWHFRPPAGESLDDVSARLAPWLAGLGQAAVVATHAGVIRVLMHRLGGITPLEAATMPIAHGAIYRFEAGGVAVLD